MKIACSDYWLLRLHATYQPVFAWLGRWEARYWSEELSAQAVDRPIFICGLARSGTTMLLEVLASIPGVATHRYRDFPFLESLILWNSALERLAKPGAAVERPHQDGILITRESPEAMEEPLWMRWFPECHGSECSARLSRDTHRAGFAEFHREHLRKVLFVRRGRRYCAKNNYHVSRIEYLAQLYPDATFLVPVRHPLSHVASLVRQHQLFCGYAEAEPRVLDWMKAAGHFEFGPQRLPIFLDPSEYQRTCVCWQAGHDHLGYAIQWKEVYGLVDELRANPNTSPQLHVVRYEDICSAPKSFLDQLLDQLGLPNARQQPSIRPASSVSSISSEEQDAVWRTVRDVAERFGYVPS